MKFIIYIINILGIYSLDISHNSIYNYQYLENKVSKKLSYKLLIKDIETHKIEKIYFSKSLTNVISEENNNYLMTPITPLITDNLVSTAIQNNVDTFFFEMPPRNIFDNIESYIAPFILITFILRFVSSFFGKNKMNLPFSFNQNLNKDKFLLQNMNISLSSFAGSDEIFEECTEVISYLNNSTLYKNAGAEIPKGILLEGPPGTGKTLLAKAIASHTNANFISVAASEFIELYVGGGALKIRNLFSMARNNLPCIIFIDEIDSIGKERSSGVNLGNDEREQTLNQLLAEMDGFTNNNGVLIMAATNRKDILDKALLRPGRFDRIIKVPFPDKNSRKEIIKVHSQNKFLDSKINFDLIAHLTNGFSGAQIKNLLNEAAIYTARDGRITITEDDILNALDKLVIGLIKSNDNRSNEELKRIAIHELGHGLLCKIFDNYFDLQKISIQQTYNGAAGYTLFNEYQNITDSGLYTKDLLKKNLIITLGGKAAEYLYYGENFVSIGAIQDLKQANSLAQKMIENYGFGNKLEVFYNDYTDTNYMKYSEKTKELIDYESLKLVNEAYEDAKNLLLKNKVKIDILIDKLIKNNVLYKDDI
jgi:cell division protease FtsH